MASSGTPGKGYRKPAARYLKWSLVSTDVAQRDGPPLDARRGLPRRRAQALADDRGGAGGDSDGRRRQMAPGPPGGVERLHAREGVVSGVSKTSKTRAAVAADDDLLLRDMRTPPLDARRGMSTPA